MIDKPDYGMSVHEVCDLLPLMAPDALAKLREDIRAHGLNHPIVLHEGQIIDGRNRLLACRAAGVEPRFIEWKEIYKGEASVARWIDSENGKRRQMTPDQILMFEAALHKWELEEAARQRMERTGRENARDENGRFTSDAPAGRVSPSAPSRTRDVLAAKTGETPHRARQALAVAADPAMAKQVIQGAKTLARAAKEVQQAKAAQPVEAVAPTREPRNPEKIELTPTNSDTRIAFTPEEVLAAPDKFSAAQRGMASAMFLPTIQEEARRARRLERTNPTGVLAKVADKDLHGDARRVAAGLFGVNKQTTAYASRILRDDPISAARVSRGELSMVAAYKLVQRALPSMLQRTTDNAAKGRMVHALTQVSGLCTGLLRIDIAGARRCCTPDETNTWVAEARKTAKQLHEFTQKFLDANKGATK